MSCDRSGVFSHIEIFQFEGNSFEYAKKNSNVSAVENCGEMKLTPEEQLVALKVLQEALAGIRQKKDSFGKTDKQNTQRFKHNSTFKEAIDFYDNWKENYYEQLIRTKTHYTNICNEWVQFNIKTKNLLEGLPEPSVPIGTDMKKFYEQVGYLEWLTMEN